MKGKILGADGNGGTISGEDSKRYKFPFDQWKSDRPPSPGEDVDFAIGENGSAEEIYPLRASGSAGAVDFGQVGDRMKELIGDGAASPVAGRVLELVKGSTLFQISLVILLASFFFTFVKLSGAVMSAATQAMPDSGTYSVFNLGDFIDYLKASLEEAATAAEQLARLTGPSPLGANTTPSPNPQSITDGLRGLETVTNLFYIAYLAPLGALAVIVQLIRRQSASLLGFATGAASVASFLGLVGWRWAIVSAAKDAGGESAASMASASIHFGFGAYTILVCGLLLLASAMGFIRLPRSA